MSLVSKVKSSWFHIIYHSLCCLTVYVCFKCTSTRSFQIPWTQSSNYWNRNTGKIQYYYCNEYLILKFFIAITVSLKHLQWYQLYQFTFYIRLIYCWYRATIWKFRIFAAFFLPTFFISRYLSFRNVCEQFVLSHFSDGIRPWNRSLYVLLHFYLAKLSSQNDKDKCK